MGVANWPQPRVDEIEIDDKHAVMSQSSFDKLLNYSHSIPTGTTPGKMWRCKCFDRWVLRWYEKHQNPSLVTINQREILIVED